MNYLGCKSLKMILLIKNMQFCHLTATYSITINTLLCNIIFIIRNYCHSPQPWGILFDSLITASWRNHKNFEVAKIRVYRDIFQHRSLRKGFVHCSTRYFGIFCSQGGIKLLDIGLRMNGVAGSPAKSVRKKFW